MQVAFIPRDSKSIPALVVIPEKGLYLFQCIDFGGEVQVETKHASFSDALIQVARRMALDGNQQYDVQEVW